MADENSEGRVDFEERGAMDLLLPERDSEEAPSANMLTLHLQELWKDGLEAQLGNFLNKFIKLLTFFVNEEKDFVEYMRAFQRLFGEDTWSGLTVVRGDNLEVVLFFEKIVFRTGTKIHLLEIELTQLQNYQGASFVEQREQLMLFMADYLSDHNSAVHFFPQSIEDVISYIRSFNLSESDR